jgi:N-methylhydantoinase A
MAPGGKESRHAYKNTRQAYFGGAFREVEVFDGLKLAPGNTISGPAIVEQPTTTIIITAGYDLVCDRFGNYVLYAKGSPHHDLSLDLAGQESIQ